MTVSVMISECDLVNLVDGKTYRSGPDGTQRVKDSLKLIGVTEPKEWVCAFVYHGPLKPQSVPYGTIEARLKTDQVLDRIYVLADQDVKDLCFNALKETKSTVIHCRLKGLVAPSPCTVLSLLQQIRPRWDSGYCEVRVAGHISIEDIEGFYSLNGDRITFDEQL